MKDLSLNERVTFRTMSPYNESCISVLLVDDSPEQRQLVGLQLAEVKEPKFEVEAVFRLSDAVERLLKGGIDVILLDLSLPDARGLEAVSVVRNKFPTVPLVVLTGTDDESLAIRALREGAEDYLVKDEVTSHVLKRVLLHGIERQRAAQALAASRERLLEGQKLEALGRLAGGIAHGFNNVLVSIIGYSDILVEELAGSDLREDAEEIRKAGERAAQLTRQILSFSRRDQPTVEPVDVNGVVQQMRGMLSGLLERKVKLDLDLTPALPTIVVDRGHLEQIVLNLVVNARDAIKEQGRIEVATSAVQIEENHPHLAVVQGPGAYVCLQVSDTGSGIDAKTAGRMFEPFFTTKEKDKGTGLGLATVHGIVQSANGGIAVDSTPGHGTIFFVYFPASTQAPSAEDEAAPPHLASPSGETVMVLEDEENLRHLIERILARAGYNVLSVGSIKEARALEDTPLDLLLLARNVEGLDGEALARDLVRRRGELRVLLITRHSAEVEDVITSFPSVTKPFTPGRLLTRIREVLQAPPPVPDPPRPGPGANAMPTARETARTAAFAKEQQLEQFEYIISHDLQEPVRMVNSYLDLLVRRAKSDLDGSALELLKFARDGGERLQQMLRGMLRLSRLRREPSNGEHASVQEAFEKLARTYRDRAEELVFTSRCTTVPMAANHLYNVLSELVDNAVKFRADRPSRVEVSVWSSDDAWTLQVRDDGVGFPEGDRDRCFEYFGRLHGRDEFEGVGLGLTYCREVATKYAGSLTIESNEGKGSTVAFRIPRTVEPERHATRGTPIEIG